jgi:hypothetical protein
MRNSHKQAPFHRIECWRTTYYRPASLWEVGTYLLVQHHQDEVLCETLQFQKHFLDSQQIKEDNEEQKRLQNEKIASDSFATVPPVPSFSAGPDVEMGESRDDIEMGDDPIADPEFETKLDGWLDGSNTDGIFDDNLDFGHAETDIHNVVEYLGPSKNNPGPDSDLDPGPGPDPDPDTTTGSDNPFPRPKADGLNNNYVRVLHTNGIHHLGLVTCSCHGQDTVALDLFACRLLPASFVRIRTIFTVQLMDYFRLCNLELKASAYQFYQLIQRLTLPMGHSELVNLYHEFRRMSRLWRWMKKLKWAGYGHNKQDYLNPPAGSLSIFCPTCPQPALNLPENWKEDKNRYTNL